MTNGRWVQLLTACGLDAADRAQWHAEFEKLSPEAHQDFLESLGIPADEVAAIRRWSGAASAAAVRKTKRPAKPRRPAAPRASD